MQAQIVIDFSKFGSAALIAAQPATGIAAWLSPALMSQFASTFTPFLIILPVLAAGVLLIYFRRTRALQVSVAVFIIFAEIIGPILTTQTNVRFYDAQAAKAASQKESQAKADQIRDVRAVLGTVNFNPHLNPMEAAAHNQK
ncbi:MAG: hypothetical protein IPK16_18290 [Anaerolineales bacterium]|nr:hypothetical protein [Anaerolineales bacterium]